ncbi:MAG: hypothetical protein ABSH28_18300 [Acidobacteriota bacterium]
MKTEIKDDAPDTPDRVREIPKWVRRYAHNRTLPVLVGLGLFLLAAAVIGGSSTLASREGQTGHKAAALALCAVSLAACALWVWLVAPRRMRRLIGALSGRLYGAEGTAVAAAKPCGRSRADLVVVIAFGLCVALSVPAGFAFKTAFRHMVPIMAIYFVPFLLYMWARQGGMAAPFMLLWPGLLVIHAVLALADVHPFSGEPNAVNMLLLPVGYGAIAALASHVYSRVALRRLRSLARRPEDDETGGGQHA